MFYYCGNNKKYGPSCSNRLFLSSTNSHFQNKAKHNMIIKNRLHISGNARSLNLNQKLGSTWNWPTGA